MEKCESGTLPSWYNMTVSIQLARSEYHCEDKNAILLNLIKLKIKGVIIKSINYGPILL